MNFEKICVLGLGYIGLPTASTFASQGARVIGVDINERVLRALRDGEVHIQEPGLRTLVQAALGSGNLAIAEAPEPADAFVIAVPTPVTEDKLADLTFVEGAARSIVPHLRAGNLVVLESTCPPRTTLGLLRPILEQSGLKAGPDFFLAYSPERVLPGHILRELIENSRVIGGVDQASSEAGRDLYRRFVRGDIRITDATTAEMVKLMENTYRDVNIALANELARLADRLGVDIWQAAELANLHPRVSILSPGPGVGGHCIGVDPWFLVEAAPELTELIRGARKVNDAQPEYAARLIERAFGGGVTGRQVACLGLTYKADVDDLRESPAIEVVRLLLARGAQARTFDPMAPGAAVEGATRCETLAETLRGAEGVVLLVNHRQLIELDPEKVADLLDGRVAVDLRSGWDGPSWRNAGFELTVLGVGAEAD